MTVRELIKELQKYPEDMSVQILASYDCGYGYAGGEIQYIEKDNIEYAVNLCNDEG